MIIHLAATNDTNGNPRRLYVRINRHGGIAQVWDEGYKGYGCVPERYRGQAAHAPGFKTTPQEYRSLLKAFA